MFYNAKLQGPAHFIDNSKNISFVTTYYENIDNESWSGKFVLNCQIFNQDNLQKYLKIMLFFHKSIPKTCSNYSPEQVSIQKLRLLDNKTVFLNV